MFAAELGFLKFLESIRTDFLNGFFELVTMLGEETILIVLLAVIYFMVDKELGRKLFFITVTSLGINGAIKNIAKVPRPFTKGISCVRPDTATGYSFPSGHTQTFSTWSTAMALHTGRRTHILLAFTGIFLVAFSRMYLGAHFPSDVIVGAALGIFMAHFCSSAYEKSKNRTSLYGIAALALTPFAVMFLFGAEELYADFYKTYGMITGFYFAVVFEDKYVSLGCEGSTAKKLLRIVICIASALVIKEGLKAIFVFSSMPLHLVFSAVRYFLLVFIEFALCPLLFKKFKL